MKGGYAFGIILIVIAVLIIATAVNNGNQNVDTEGAVEEIESNKVPDFTLQDHNGNLVDRKDFRRKILVLSAWASWCPFCVDELSELAKVQKEFGEEVVIIAINRAEPLPIADDFIKNLGIENDLVFLQDPKDSFYKSIGGYSMPETIFANKKGEIIEHKREPINSENMIEIIRNIIDSD